MPPELYFDVGSPYSFLAVERAERVLGELPELRPVLLGGLFKLSGRSSWGVGDPALREAGMLEVESRATAYDLPAIRWPRPWPGDYLIAMRIAAWADARRAGPAFAFAAGRRLFLAGRDLTLADGCAAAAEEAGLDGTEALRAAGRPEVKAALRRATEQAYARGVVGVPTVAVGGELFWGDDRLEEAATRLRPAATASGSAAR
jgi:2-hydroxychromene-2-carboxylate isomerase